MNLNSKRTVINWIALVILVLSATTLVVLTGVRAESITSLWLSLPLWVLLVLAGGWLFAGTTTGSAPEPPPPASANPVTTMPSTRKKQQKEGFDMQSVTRKIVRRTGTGPGREPEKWGENLLKQLVDELEIMSGVFYVKDPGGVFKSAFTYACPHTTGPYIFSEGEGLTGQAVKNRQITIYRAIPDDYTSVFSGLGSGKPAYLAIVPLETDNEITAVLEVAGFKWSEENLEQFFQVLTRELTAGKEDRHEKEKNGKEGS